jgi:hypothetical protein
MIFFKKPTVTVDCFITNNSIAELFPITPLMEQLPTWWKSMSKTAPIGNFPVQMSTIKRCPGFKDLFKNGLCIPAWSEYQLFQDPTYGFSHTAPNHVADGMQHKELQMDGAYSNYQHYKLINPWLLSEKSGISFIMTQASWHDMTPCEYHIPVGSLEFKYQHATHINLVAPKQPELKQINIPAGQPLVYLLPQTEKKIKLNIQVVSDVEYNKLKTYHHSFHNSYETTKKILKDIK